MSLKRNDEWELTDPDANADDHSDSWGAVAKRFQWVDCDIAAVSTHSGQGDAGGLYRHLGEIVLNDELN